MRIFFFCWWRLFPCWFVLLFRWRMNDRKLCNSCRGFLYVGGWIKVRGCDGEVFCDKNKKRGTKSCYRWYFLWNFAHFSGSERSCVEQNIFWWPRCRFTAALTLIFRDSLEKNTLLTLVVAHYSAHHTDAITLFLSVPILSHIESNLPPHLQKSDHIFWIYAHISSFPRLCASTCTSLIN